MLAFIPHHLNSSAHLNTIVRAFEYNKMIVTVLSILPTAQCCGSYFVPYHGWSRYAFRMMQFRMNWPSHEFQVIKSIIVSDAIYMVDNFIGIQKATQCLLHNKSVLFDIAINICKRMVRYFDFNITIRTDYSTALPARAICTPHFANMSQCHFLPISRSLPNLQLIKADRAGFATLRSSIWQMFITIYTRCHGYSITYLHMEV